MHLVVHGSRRVRGRPGSAVLAAVRERTAPEHLGIGGYSREIFMEPMTPSRVGRRAGAGQHGQLLGPVSSHSPTPRRHLGRPSSSTASHRLARLAAAVLLIVCRSFIEASQWRHSNDQYLLGSSVM